MYVSINHSIDQSICYLSIGPLGSDDGNSWKDAVRGTHFKPLNVTCICVTSECYLLFMWMLPLNDIFLNLWMLPAIHVNVTFEWNLVEPLNVVELNMQVWTEKWLLFVWIFCYIVYSPMYATQRLQKSNYALDHHDSCVNEWIKYVSDS